MSNYSVQKAINSALWAAYGDALGFITELADEKILKTRTGKKKVEILCDWKRKIGGGYGPTVDMPSGTYSDDTQLRLASSRSINVNGHFSVQSFSKIEIPVWQSYALGAGRGSKVAAAALAKKNTAWFSNFYNDKKAQYVNAGGNGGVMRIQPHVWSAKHLHDPNSFLLDVIKNTLVTHGHPRAIAGSVMHALSLADAIRNNRVANSELLHNFNEWTLQIPNLIKKDINLSTSWIPQFESEYGKNIEEAYQDVHEEIEALINIVDKWCNNEQGYNDLVSALDLTNESIRGSGTLTAIAASAASTLLPKQGINSLIVEISNCLGTDTDSIATMVGAICGSISDNSPPSPVQDQAYIELDAKRLFYISQGKVEGELNHNYQYPSPLSWKGPNSSLDYIVNSKQGLYFEPFGIVHKVSEAYSSNSTEKYNYVYQWIKSTIGQTFLAKMRNKDSLIELEAQDKDTPQPTNDFIQDKNPQLDLIDNNSKKYEASASHRVVEEKTGTPDINQLTSKAISSKFDHKVIGEHIITISDSDLGINGVIAYSAIIAKARVARNSK
ncbi:ADP-ribosylglycohydrolase family protein [Vibrio natriegens]|uniref:ADP-ribosylglycohydrolase family protein n=1 Tax=Vibrio natriegens TaxID=691 RepID=UPI003F86CF81